MLSKKEIQEILVDIKADGMPDFQQKVEKTTARMGELREQIREVKEGLSILRAKGQEGSESFVTLEKQSKDLDKELKTLTVDQKGYTNALNINQMSAKQLAERSSVLKGTLDCR